MGKIVLSLSLFLSVLSATFSNLKGGEHSSNDRKSINHDNQNPKNKEHMKRISQEELDKIVSRLERKKNVHGSVFYVSSKDESMNLFSSTGNLNPDQPYYIASINKLMISFIILRYINDGQLQWDDSIWKFLPQEWADGLLVYKGKDYSSELTIKHLISHTSGLPCYLIDKRPDGKKNMDLILKAHENQSWPMDKVIGEVKLMNPKFIPGSVGKASYSETNFRLLGRIIEKIAQKPLDAVLQSLFEELDMRNTFVLNVKNATQCAPVYHKPKEIEISAYWESSKHDVASTAGDQMKFIKAFFTGGHFSDAFIEELKDWNNVFFPFKYGKGVQKFYMPRILSPFSPVPEIIGHCGSVGTIAFYVPERDLFITGTVNQTANNQLVFQTMMKIISRCKKSS